MAEAEAKRPYLSTGLYTQFFLRNLYNWQVMSFNYPYVWNCPSDVPLNLFLDNFSQRHLDCGVATGYFPATALKRSPHAQSEHQVTLVDLSPNSLNAAKEAILAEAPQAQVQTVLADIKAPIPAELEGSKFDSISMFNLFHCVPGGPSKFEGINTYKELLTENGVLIGCTILGEKYAPNLFARLYVQFYNWLGVFSNWDDKEEDVVNVLQSGFEEVDSWRVGMALLFRAKRPKSSE